MRKVGVKALKNGLSRYLKIVQTGQTVLVTDRDRVVARITRPPGQSLPLSRWKTFLDEERERGKLTAARRRDVSDVLDRLRARPRWKHGDAVGILSELREDRT